MTRKEAIKDLEYIKNHVREIHAEAFNMAIESLSKEVIPCEECIHAKQHSYAPAECQWYCTISLQYHGGRFFCACGERGTDLLEWIHRGDDDEQGV